MNNETKPFDLLTAFDILREAYPMYWVEHTKTLNYDALLATQSPLAIVAKCLAVYEKSIQDIIDGKSGK